MKKIIIIGLSFLTLISCNQNKSKNGIEKENACDSVLVEDSGFVVIETNKFLTAKATKLYSTKNRKSTQFAIDEKSIIETPKRHIIKISEKEVIICDKNNIKLSIFSIQKKWIDKTGPSTVYDLIDQNKIEYSLDHFTYENDHYIRFRFKDSLKTYMKE